MDQTTANPAPVHSLSGEGVTQLILTQRSQQPATDSVALVYDERKRSRLKVQLASGAEAGIFLERGDYLQDGDKLQAEENPAVVEIRAAPEKLIEAVASSPLLFARAAYHLGNRHVPVQILPTDNGGKLRFQTDHVLAEMLRGLGCAVHECAAPFQPESGAYGGGHRHHADAAPDLHHPGHGPHRSVPKIHQFKPR